MSVYGMRTLLKWKTNNSSDGIIDVGQDLDQEIDGPYGQT